MKRDSFVFYRSFYEATKELPEQEQLIVYNTIIEYALNGIELETQGISRAIFALVKPQIDANTKRYENGLKGGRKPKQNQEETKKEPKGNRKKTKTKANDNENANVNVNANEKKINFAQYVSMTQDEFNKLVKSYGEDFTNKCIVALDNYKGSSGKYYKSDYRAILTWVVEKVKKDEPNEKKKPYQNYDQRNIENFEGFYIN